MQPGIESLARAANIMRLVDHELVAAENLVSPQVWGELRVRDELQAIKAQGYRHFALDLLQDMGRSLEESGRDELLPAHYWRHLARSAELLEFFRMVPYLTGKADGFRRRTWNDNLASMICLQRLIAPSMAATNATSYAVRMRHAPLATELDEFVLYLVTQGRLDPLRLGADAPALLSQYLDEQRVLYGNANDPVFVGINQRFQGMVDALLKLCIDDAIASNRETRDIAWSIQCVNYFRIIVDPRSSLPVTVAEIAWRCP